VPFFAASNGDWVRSTPVFDGNTLFVGDMRETLVALDGATGEERWRVDLPARFDRPVPDFGFASSPLVDGDHLYLQAADSLVKLDKRTGATSWRTLEQGSGMTSSGAFSSPILATLAGVRQLVVQTREALHGVDPHSGRVLWSQPVPNFRGMNILTPVVVGDAIFTSPYRHGSFRYDVARADDAWTVTTAWSNKASGYMSTPVVADGHLFLHLGNERLDCLDLATGESRWRSEPVGKYWSMVRRGDKILALSERGILHLLRADPGAFRQLASRKVADQETWGHLAASGNELFVRELRAISAWRWNPVPPTEPGGR
jgi:outer membrane protein assembly factor BamB